MRAYIFLFSILTLSAFAQEYDRQEFSPQPLIESVTRTGKLEFKRTTQLSFKSSGYLKTLAIDEGQTFEKGELLAALDIAELKANKNSAYAELVKAKRDATRVKKLFEEGLASDEDVDNSQTLIDTKRAAFKVANYNLEKATIIAPFYGLVLTKTTELDELQSPGSPVLEVASLENNWVIRVSLTETEITQIELNQEVSVRLRNKSQFAGIVSKIPGKASGNNNLYTIEISLPDVAIKKGMIAGQLAEVTLFIKTDDLVYQVPIKALNGIDDKGNGVFISRRGDSYHQLSLPIVKVDNQFAYLHVADNNKNIGLLTSGWQHVHLPSH